MMTLWDFLLDGAYLGTNFLTHKYVVAADSENLKEKWRRPMKWNEAIPLYVTKRMLTKSEGMIDGHFAEWLVFVLRWVRWEHCHMHQ